MPAKNLSHLAQLIADDGHAASFQSLGQYRSALLKEIAQASAAPEQEPFGYTNDAQISVLAEGRIANLYPCEGPGMNPIKLYTHPSAEIERLRAENKRLETSAAFWGRTAGRLQGKLA